MNQLHFVQSLDIKAGGGLGSSALALNDWTNRSGTTSRLVAAGQWNDAYGPNVIVRPAIGPKKFFYSPGLRKLGRELVSEATQVHGHGFYTYLNWLFGHEARRQHKPFCYHIQGIFDPYILQRSRVKKRVVGWLFEDANFKVTRLWRALSLREADQARAVGVRARIEVIPNGIDLDPSFNAQQLRRDWFEAGGRKVLLFLGRLHEKKGLDMLLPALARVKQQHRGWMLAIVGPDENNQQARLKTMIDELALHDDVRFYPAVAGEQKRTVLASADAFVLPTRSEGMPVAVLEAAAAGLPILMTTECNLPEFGGTGGSIIVEPRESEIERGLTALFASDDLELKQRAHDELEVVKRHFHWPVVIERWLAICREL